MAERPPADSVAALIRRLRGLHGHLSAKDQRIVVEAIEGLTELTLRLHETEVTVDELRRTGRAREIEAIYGAVAEAR